MGLWGDRYLVEWLGSIAGWWGYGRRSLFVGCEGRSLRWSLAGDRCLVEFWVAIVVDGVMDGDRWLVEY